MMALVWYLIPLDLPAELSANFIPPHVRLLACYDAYIYCVIIKRVFCCCEGNVCQEKLNASCDLLFINR